MTSGRPISEFEAWIASGGEARAGLPAGSLSTLSGSLAGLKATMELVFVRLRAITGVWNQLAGDNGLGDNAAKELINSVLNDLTDAYGLLATGQSQASAVSSDANLARTRIGGSIAAYKAMMAVEQVEIERLEALVNSLNMRLTNIRNEVEGWDGFWKGMAIVFSLGIYDPMEENRSKIRQEIEATNALAVSARAARELKETHQRELEACLSTLDRIDGLEARVAELAQDVSEGLRQARDARVQAEKAQERDGGLLGPIFARLAAHRIGNLVTWASNSRPFE